jgi:hypothetical protein
VALYRFENGALYKGSHLIATAKVRIEIHDPRGRRMGILDGSSVHDDRGRLVGTVLQSGVFDQRTHRLTGNGELEREIQNTSDPLAAALWLLCVNTPADLE